MVSPHFDNIHVLHISPVLIRFDLVAVDPKADSKRKKTIRATEQNGVRKEFGCELCDRSFTTVAVSLLRYRRSEYEIIDRSRILISVIFQGLKRHTRACEKIKEEYPDPQPDIENDIMAADEYVLPSGE